MGSERRRGWGFLMIGMMSVLGGCKPSPSEKWLRKCEEAEARGDIGDAWNTCSIVVMTEPSGKAADLAREKLKKFQPEHEKLEKEHEQREKEQAEARAKAAKAAEEAKAVALAQAKLKVNVQWEGFEPDGECTGKGLPPYRKNYSGGTYDEDELVALAAGCVHLFQRRNNMNDRIFCCPK